MHFFGRFCMFVHQLLVQHSSESSIIHALRHFFGDHTTRHFDQTAVRFGARRGRSDARSALGFNDPRRQYHKRVRTRFVGLTVRKLLLQALQLIVACLKQGCHLASLVSEAVLRNTTCQSSCGGTEPTRPAASSGELPQNTHYAPPGFATIEVQRTANCVQISSATSSLSCANFPFENQRLPQP